MWTHVKGCKQGEILLWPQTDRGQVEGLSCVFVAKNTFLYNDCFQRFGQLIKPWYTPTPWLRCPATSGSTSSSSLSWTLTRPSRILMWRRIVRGTLFRPKWVSSTRLDWLSPTSSTSSSTAFPMDLFSTLTLGPGQCNLWLNLFYNSHITLIRSYILTVYHDLFPCIICPAVVIFNNPMIKSKAIQLLTWTPEYQPQGCVGCA